MKEVGSPCATKTDYITSELAEPTLEPHPAEPTGQAWRASIGLNEGFATCAEWLWAEHEGQATPQEILLATYEAIPANDPLWDVVIGDPTVEFLFERQPRLTTRRLTSRGNGWPRRASGWSRAGTESRADFCDRSRAGLTSKEDGGTMPQDIWVQISWVVCGATAIVASVLAIWRLRDPGW